MINPILQKDDGDALATSTHAPVAPQALLPKSEQERLRQLQRPLPLGFIESELAKTLDHRKLLRDFAIYVPFILSFMFFMFIRRNIEDEFYVSEAITALIYNEPLPPTNPLPGSPVKGLPLFHKVYDEIDNVGDWYDYVEAILITPLFSDTDYADPQRRIAGQTVPLGALRIRSKHVKPNSCTVNGAFYPADSASFPRTCYGAYSSSNERKGVYQYDAGLPNFTYHDEYCSYGLLYTQGQYEKYDCGGFVVDIPFNTSRANALNTVAQLREGYFGYPVSARALFVEMILYHPPTDTFLSALLLVEVSEAGGFMKQKRFRPFILENLNVGEFINSFILLAFVLYYWYRFFADWVYSARVKASCFAYLCNVWSLLEFANLVTFSIMFCFFWYWWAVSDRQDWDLAHPTGAFPVALVSIGEVYTIIVWLNALNTVLCFLKLLKFLRINSRLNILSQTVENAAQSIVGILILFLLVVTAYSLAGHILYGTGVERYRTTAEAFASSFRSLVGQYDYQAMKDENRAVTFIFFWSFTIICLFILLNFVIAVVMDCFNEEVERIKTVPLDVAIQQTWRSFVRFVTMPRIFSRVAKAILNRAYRMPEQLLHEYIAKNIMHLATTAKRQAAEEDEGEGNENDERQKEEEEGAEAQECDMEALEEAARETLFLRWDFAKIVPVMELEDIGDIYLDAMWLDMEAEYSTSHDNSMEKEAVALTQAAVRGVSSAMFTIVRPFYAKLFPDSDTSATAPASSGVGGGESNAADAEDDAAEEKKRCATAEAAAASYPSQQPFLLSRIEKDENGEDVPRTVVARGFDEIISSLKERGQNVTERMDAISTILDVIAGKLPCSDVAN